MVSILVALTVKRPVVRDRHLAVGLRRDAMNQQMPKIIPFSNLSLQRKFEELSDKLVLDVETK